VFETLAIVGLLGLGVLTISMLCLVFLGRRRDVSWSELLIAGPLVVVHPERYLQASSAARVPLLVLIWLGLFVFTAIASSIAEFWGR
jgi:hypothetical protein